MEEQPYENGAFSNLTGKQLLVRSGGHYWVLFESPIEARVKFCMNGVEPSFGIVASKCTRTVLEGMPEHNEKPVIVSREVAAFLSAAGDSLNYPYEIYYADPHQKQPLANSRSVCARLVLLKRP